VPLLILSDIHANLEALEAVLADAQGRYTKILCLGDLVGYGADPNPVVEWTRAHVEVVVRGNHDRACVGLDPIEGYNAAARASTEWTKGVLTKENVEYLERLPRGPVPYSCEHGSCDLVHGSPADEDDYLLNFADVYPLRPLLETQVTFFGHTHVQGGFLLTRTGVGRIHIEGTIEIEPDYLFLLNPGAVGQPRDGDPRAAYALYSPEDRSVEYKRVVYDIDRAASKILDAGLPDSLARRLFEGV